MTAYVSAPIDCTTHKVLMAVHWRKRQVVTEMQALGEELETLHGLSHRIRRMDPQEALQAIRGVLGDYPLPDPATGAPGASWRVLGPLDVDLSTV